VRPQALWTPTFQRGSLKMSFYVYEDALRQGRSVVDRATRSRAGRMRLAERSNTNGAESIGQGPRDDVGRRARR